MSTAVTVVKKRVYKKIPLVIRNNLTTDQKKSIIKFIAKHKISVNKTLKEAAKAAEKEAAKAAKAAKAAEKEAAKAAKAAEKEAAKAAKAAEKEAAKAAKAAEKEAAKAAKAAEKEAAKAAKAAEKQAKKTTVVKVNKEKRKPSPFAMYMKSVRSSVKNDNPDASFGEITKIVSEKWKMLSDDEKNQYKVE
jgi:dsDNA-specific endonuclease/ATPase MutS2